MMNVILLGLRAIVWISLLVVMVMFGIVTWKGFYHSEKELDSTDYLGGAIAAGVLITLGIVLLRLLNGKPFFEQMFLWFLMVTFVAWVIVKGRVITEWLQDTPPLKIALAVAIIPVAFILNELVLEWVAFPLFRKLMMAWDEYNGVYLASDDYFRYASLCETAVKSMTIVLLGATIKYAISLRTWLILLPAYAVGAIIAVFVPVGVAGVLVVLLLIVIVIVLGPICQAYTERFYRVKHAVDARSVEEERAVKRIMWHERFDEPGDK